MTFLPSRRTLIRGAALSTAYLATGPAIARLTGGPAWPGNPFTLGVAAGAPARDGFVLWTMLAPTPGSEDPASPGGMTGPSVKLRYEIAVDPGMQHVVQRGAAVAEAEYGYSVHKQITGLRPGRPYWYRSISGNADSRIGRAMTLPGRNLDKLRFAFFSCSNYESGYFSAYRHAASEAPDFGVFLGDYIYEYVDPGTKHAVVRHHSGGKECVTLPEYRARYAQYRQDLDLQILHANVPSLLTWDDHEVQNDYADKWGEEFQDPKAFLERRAAAYRAFYEFMPLKPVFSAPHGPDMRVYDRYDFGDLLRVNLIDGRQYRSREACYGDPRKSEGHAGGGHLESAQSCPELFDAQRSMIGLPQEQWLFDGLATSKARWNVIANDVLMARLRQDNADGGITGGWWTDDWDGYPASRTRLLDHIAQSKPSNPVVITGDIHSFWANDLKADFDNPNSATLASELVGTSVTSYGPPYDLFAKFVPNNPHVKFFDSRKRGYVSVELTRDKLVSRFQSVSDVRDPNAEISTLASFVIEDGKPGPVAA